MKLTPEQTTAGIAALLFLGAVAAYGVLYARISWIHDDLMDAQEEVVRLTAQQESHETLVRFLDSSVADRTELETHILALDNPSPYLVLLEEVAHDAQVTAEVETLNAVMPKGGDTTATTTLGSYLELTVAVEGAWPAVYRFISLLEHLPYATHIERVVAEYDTDGVWQGKISLRTLGK